MDILTNLQGLLSTLIPFCKQRRTYVDNCFQLRDAEEVHMTSDYNPTFKLLFKSLSCLLYLSEVHILNLYKVCNYIEGNSIVTFSNVTISDEQLTKERIEDLIY
jgi:hypothetical protein